MTPNRRDMIFAAACVGALGTAEWLRPRRELNLLGTNDLEAIVPRAFGGWTSESGGDFVVPETPDSLASRLYAKQLLRQYSANGLPPVMLVMAYGSSQSDALQLHRPEACYSAVGFAIRDRRLSSLPIIRGAAVPAVALSAVAEGRTEDIVYWTRLGDSLPQTAESQRHERPRAAMAGYVGDGVLVRASIARTGANANFALITRFLRDMVLAMPRQGRPALVGTAIGTQLERA